jgi:hypothetical protein
MELGNCQWITDFCLAEGGVLKITEFLIHIKTLHQWPDLVFLIPTDAAYTLHIPLRQSMQIDLS